ncbi:MAG: hypothetical protein IJX53_08395 [Clostridia bacterium]|nr:hypothetical protein [Clostridia bacterium]
MIDANKHCESGANELPVRHLIILARFYRVSIGYLSVRATIPAAGEGRR